MPLAIFTERERKAISIIIWMLTLLVATLYAYRFLLSALDIKLPL